MMFAVAHATSVSLRLRARDVGEARYRAEKALVSFSAQTLRLCASAVQALQVVMSIQDSSRPSEATTRRQRVSSVASTSVVGVSSRQPPRSICASSTIFQGSVASDVIVLETFAHQRRVAGIEQQHRSAPTTPAGWRPPPAPPPAPAPASPAATCARSAWRAPAPAKARRRPASARSRASAR